MSREIKFRAWDKINNKMYPIAGISFTNKDTWLQINEKQIMGANFKEIEIMQYTGLKDKNDKEIYEGDIVECKESNIICEVIFSEGAMFMLKWHDTRYGNDSYHYYGLGAFTLSIIGNIYENLELLKEV